MAQREAVSVDAPACLILWGAIDPAIVNEQGIQFTHIDSGPVQGSDTYTTLIMLHGMTYHAREHSINRCIVWINTRSLSESFKKMFPLASKHNLRLVAVNRRDYAHSTPLTSEELAQIKSKDEAICGAFMHDRGSEIARFMIWFIHNHNIPKASEDGLTGGISLLGWSAGNSQVLATMRHLESFPREIVDELEPYWTSVILYGM